MRKQVLIHSLLDFLRRMVSGDFWALTSANTIHAGTGTLIGDPTEASAIGSVFSRHRSQEEPLYM